MQWFTVDRGSHELLFTSILDFPSHARNIIGFRCHHVSSKNTRRWLPHSDKTHLSGYRYWRCLSKIALISYPTLNMYNTSPALVPIILITQQPLVLLPISPYTYNRISRCRYYHHNILFLVVCRIITDIRRCVVERASICNQ